MTGSRWAKQADTVVVGGGIRGLAITYYLAQAGINVVLFERHELLHGASGANLGYVNVSGKEPGYYTQLSLASQRLYRVLAQHLGDEIDYQCRGSLSVAETGAQLRAIADFACKQSLVPGLQVEVLDTAQARDLEPALSPQIAGATFCASDGVVNPLSLGRAFARAALRLGARIHTRTAVHAIELKGGCVTAVETGRGRVSAPIVVNAAGIQAPEVGRMAGVEIPVVAVHGQVLVTAPLPPLLSRPVSSYVQTQAGNLLLGTTYGLFEADSQVTSERAERIAQKAARILPALRGVPIIRTFAAARPWPVDGLPMMGTAPGWPEGFICAAGHSGVTLAPVTGQVIAELITTGTTSWPIEEYNPSRFARVRLMFPMAMYGRWLEEHR